MNEPLIIEPSSDPEEPCLWNILQRLKALPKHQFDLLLLMYTEVACGERDLATRPLPPNVQLMAAQAMSILMLESVGEKVKQ